MATTDRTTSAEPPRKRATRATTRIAFLGGPSRTTWIDTAPPGPSWQCGTVASSTCPATVRTLHGRGSVTWPDRTARRPGPIVCGSVSQSAAEAPPFGDECIFASPELGDAVTD